MINANGDVGFYSYANVLAGNSTGVKLNFDPLYITTIAKLRKIAYAFPSANGSVTIKLQDGAGNDLTNAITLSGTTAYKTYYHTLTPSNFATGWNGELQLGDVVRVNVTTTGTNFYIGLFVD